MCQKHKRNNYNYNNNNNNKNKYKNKNKTVFLGFMFRKFDNSYKHKMNK